MNATTPPDDTQVLRVRDFRLFLTGRFLSNMSIQMQSVAVGWQVYDLTSDPLALGYVGLAVFIPVAGLTLPAGDVADRFDRRAILIGSHIVQAIAAAAFLAVSLSGTAVVWPFYVIMALFGAARAFAGPASQSFVPFLVARTQVTRAIAWSSSVNQVATIAGPALGGLVYIFGPDAVYGTCLASFVLVIAAISGIRTQVRPAPPEAGMTAAR